MSNSYDKFLDLKEDGAFEFDPTDMGDVLNLAYSKGLRQQIMFDAMDILRGNPKLTDSEVIILAAKKWNLI